MCFTSLFVIGPFRLAADPDLLLPRFGRVVRARVVAVFVLVFAGAFVVAADLHLHLYDLADVIAQSPIPAGRLAELNRELSQQVLPLEITASLRDLVLQCFRKRKVLKKCDDVCERFVECEYVGVGRFAKASVQAIQ